MTVTTMCGVGQQSTVMVSTTTVQVTKVMPLMPRPGMLILTAMAMATSIIPLQPAISQATMCRIPMTVTTVRRLPIRVQ